MKFTLIVCALAAIASAVELRQVGEKPAWAGDDAWAESRSRAGERAAWTGTNEEWAASRSRKGERAEFKEPTP